MFVTELIAQSPAVTNWLTPIWLLSVGISFGFLLVLFGLLKIWVMSKVPFLSRIGDGPMWPVFGGILTLVYVAIGIVFFVWAYYGSDFSENAIRGIPLFLGFIIPLALLLGFGAWKLLTPRGSLEIFGLQREGFLWWTNMICVGSLLFALIGFGLAMVNGFGFIKFVDEPYALLNSATRIPVTGLETVKVEIPPTPDKVGGTEVAVSFYGTEADLITILTDQPLEIAAQPVSRSVPTSQIYSVPASSDLQIRRRREDGQGVIPNRKIDKLYVVNIGNSPANLELSYFTQPIFAEVWIIPWAAFFVVMLYLSYWASAAMFPKVFAVAFSTFKTEVSQPLFLVVLMSGLAFIMFSIWIPYNTFGEDIKMYKDSGLTLIRVLAIFLAVWAASKSVAEEIEGRTALTVLSKPIGRRQFILGKFSGISLMVGLMFILLGVWFIAWTSYKPIYDGKESVTGMVEWQIAFGHGIGMIPALFLVFLEVIIFVAISVAISTRLGILPNFLICFSIYVLGHLTPLIVQSSYGDFAIVQTFANLIAIVFPVLNHFDVQAAIHTNSPVPMNYIGWSVMYCTLYGSIAMLIALVLFEDRDLA